MREAVWERKGTQIRGESHAKHEAQTEYFIRDDMILNPSRISKVEKGKGGLFVSNHIIHYKKKKKAFHSSSSWSSAPSQDELLLYSCTTSNTICSHCLFSCGYYHSVASSHLKLDHTSYNTHTRCCLFALMRGKEIQADKAWRIHHQQKNSTSLFYAIVISKKICCMCWTHMYMKWNENLF